MLQVVLIKLEQPVSQSWSITLDSWARIVILCQLTECLAVQTCSARADELNEANKGQKVE